MKQITTIFAVCLVAIAAIAQKKADIVVSYDIHYINYADSSVSTSRMTLLANARNAKYFNDVSLWNDSLSSTPQGKEQLQQIIMAACMTRTPEGGVSFDMRKGPVKKIYTYVFTDLADALLTYYGKFGDNLAFYTEPMDELQWQISDSTATILGYDCVMASADYHGRKWTAWFAPDIPVPFGPWKLHGLPGLILKAKTGNGSEFVATGLANTGRIMTPIYSPDSYQKTERKKALAEDEYYLNNMEAIIQAKYNGRVQFNYNTTTRPKYDALKYALEPDYKTEE